MRQIQEKAKSIARFGKNIDIKDLIEDKMAADPKEPANLTGKRKQQGRRPSSSSSSREEIHLLPEKVASLKRTQHCFQKGGEAYKGLLYVQQ